MKFPFAPWASLGFFKKAIKADGAPHKEHYEPPLSSFYYDARAAPAEYDIFIAKSEKALPPLEWDVSE